MTQPAELVLAQIWNAQWLVESLQTTDGRPLRVVYRGVWTHGLGPDFSGAYLDLGGRLVQGDVEIHVRASEWMTHEHHLDPAYNGVALHVVLDDDLAGPPRRQNGGTVATLELSRNLPGPPEAFPTDPDIRPLGAIGFDHCAPRVAAAWPDALRAVWESAGDRRMDAKVNAIAGRLALEPPALTLYALLLDAMGFSQNRAAMTELAGRLPYDHLLARMAGQSRREGWERAAALLLGIGGFLPLSPREAEFAELSGEQIERIERAWESLGAAWRDARLPSSAWQLARVRPASHPLRRLLALATLLSRVEHGLIETICALVEQPEAYGAAQAWLTGENRYLGQAHAHEIIVKAVRQLFSGSTSGLKSIAASIVQRGLFRFGPPGKCLYTRTRTPSLSSNNRLSLYGRFQALRLTVDTHSSISERAPRLASHSARRATTFSWSDSSRLRCSVNISRLLSSAARTS